MGVPLAGLARTAPRYRGQILHQINDTEAQLGRKTEFNAGVLAHCLGFARDPTTSWPDNLRDLRASAHRMVVLAEHGRITLAMVETGIGALCGQWAAAAAGTDVRIPAEVLADPGTLDELDRAQLAAVCRESASLPAAGRRLFTISQQKKTSQNDANRLRKYLARFGLDWGCVN